MLGFEGDDLFMPVHDSTVGLDRPFHYFVSIFQIDNGHLRRSGIVTLLADANEAVGFERLREQSSGRGQTALLEIIHLHRY